MRAVWLTFYASVVFEHPVGGYGLEHYYERGGGRGERDYRAQAVDFREGYDYPRYEPHDYAPAELEHYGRFFLALHRVGGGAHHRDRRGHRVRRGAEREDYDDEEGRDCDFSERQEVEEGEHRGLDALFAEYLRYAEVLDYFHVYRGAAEEGEPHHSEGRGQQQVHDCKLADGAPVGHAREEHAGDRRPGVPYREEEERPDAREAVAAYRREEEVAAEEGLDVVCERFKAEVDVEYRRPDYEDEAEEYEEELAVDVADEPHAALDAGAARGGVYRYHKQRYDSPRDARRGHAELRVEAARDLEHAFAERGDDAAREREDDEGVEYLSPEAFHALAENRDEGGAYRARGLHVVEGVGAGDSAYRVHRVGRQRPFEEYLREREARRLF